MNKASRKTVGVILDRLQNELSVLEGLRDEEQEKFDNMPEGLQASEQGQATEAAASDLAEAVSGLEEAISHLEAVV